MKKLIGINNVHEDGGTIEWMGQFSDNSERRFRISLEAEETLRFQMSDSDGSINSNGASQQLKDEINQNENRPAVSSTGLSGLQLKQTNNTFLLSISEGQPQIEIDQLTGAIRLLDRSGNLLTEIISIEQDDPGISVTGTLKKAETLFGTGERFNGVNQRGKSIRIWAIDEWCETEGNSYVPVPFFISSRRYGIFLNRFESSLLDLGNTDPDKWKLNAEDSRLDLYFFLHDNPKDQLTSYSSLTGFSPLPAEWTFGVHVSRHGRTGEFKDPDKIKTMIEKMNSYDLPYSSVIIEGWDTFNPETYTDLKEIVEIIHNKGKKVLVYEACGRVPLPADWDGADNSGLIKSMREAKEEYLIHNSEGDSSIEESAAHNPADAPHRRFSRYLDITNPDAVNWWLESVWKPLIEEIGIDGAKIDFCEQIPEHGGIEYSDGRSPEGMHHLYPVIYNRIMYRYFTKHRPDGAMCFSRGGGIGAQRYPFLWCGDQLREWKFLRAILSGTLSLGVSGIPFVSHDLGGYLPTESPEENNEARVFIRGTQLACFSLNMQTHGTVTRPYDFDTATVNLYRVYSKIHYALIPYLQEYSKTACETGVPVLRHLFLNFPDDKNVFKIEDQYLLGEDLLVAPILDDQTTRGIYFPEGNWECLYTGKQIPGNTTLKLHPAPLSRIPVFIRENYQSRTLKAVLKEIKRIIRQDL